MFQNDSERHSNSIGQRDAPVLPHSTRTSPLPQTVCRPTPTQP
jgi:hypothetical protein